MTQIIPNIPFRLVKGHSENPAAGTCVNAAIAWIEHGLHTDHPACVAPIITAFTIPANDAMDDATRQRFVPYMARMAGSYSTEHDAARIRIMMLAAVRVFAPMALDAAGLHKEAAALRALPDNASFEQVSKAAHAATHAARAAHAATATTYAAHADYAATHATHAAHAAADADAAHADYAAADAAHAATRAAHATKPAWDAYFQVLDAVLNAGPQGSAWDQVQIETGVAAFRAAGGVLEPQ